MGAKSKNSLLIPIATAVIGAVLGSALTYNFSRLNIENKNVSDKKSEAYISFISSRVALNIVTKNASSDEGKKSDETSSEYKQAVIDQISSRFQIALYGSEEVVESLAKIASLENSNLSPGEDNSAFNDAVLEMFRRMRNELLRKDTGISDEMFKKILKMR